MTSADVFISSVAMVTDAGHFLLSPFAGLFFSACLICPFLRRKVTIDLEFHFTKRTKPKSSRSPYTRYHIYIYRLPQITAPTTSGCSPALRGPSGPPARFLRWEDQTCPPSSPWSFCKPVSSLPICDQSRPRGQNPGPDPRARPRDQSPGPEPGTWSPAPPQRTGVSTPERWTLI